MSPPRSAPPTGLPSVRRTISCTDSTWPGRTQYAVCGSVHVLSSVEVVAHADDRARDNATRTVSHRMTLLMASEGGAVKPQAGGRRSRPARARAMILEPRIPQHDDRTTSALVPQPTTAPAPDSKASVIAKLRAIDCTTSRNRRVCQTRINFGSSTRYLPRQWRTSVRFYWKSSLRSRGSTS